LKKKKTTGWSENETIAFFSKNRKFYEHLYESEKFFLTKKFISSIENVLDIGCSVGGFCRIFQYLNKNIKYTGIDTSEIAIQNAKKVYEKKNNANFVIYDGFSKLPFPNKEYDLVFSSGLFHLIDNFKDLASEAICKSKKYVLIDFRVCRGKSYKGKFNFKFLDKKKVENFTNYHVLNLKDLLTFFKSFKRISKINMYGYKATPSSMSEGIDEVFMIFFKIELSKRKNQVIDLVYENDELKNFFS